MAGTTLRCGSCGKKIAAGYEMQPGKDGEVWYLGACCWEDRKVEPTGAAVSAAETSPIDLSNVPAKRYPAKDDVGSFERAPKKPKRGHMQ